MICTTVILQGRGNLSSAQVLAVESLGYEVVSYADPQCLCGHGCKTSKCAEARRWWVNGDDDGSWLSVQGRRETDRLRAVIAEARR